MEYIVSTLEQRRMEFDLALEACNLSDLSRERIKYAQGLANYLHQGDRYAHGAFDVHFLDNAIGVIEAGFGSEEHGVTICAGLLHDSVEKHPEKLVRIAQQAGYQVASPFEAIDALLDLERVGSIVAAVTNEKNKPRELYAALLDARLSAGEPESIVVKTVDIFKNIANLFSLGWTGDAIPKRIKKYQGTPEILDKLITECLIKPGLINDIQAANLLKMVNANRERLAGTAAIHKEMNPVANHG